jgi:hypothetical protein
MKSKDGFVQAYNAQAAVDAQALPHVPAVGRPSEKGSLIFCQRQSFGTLIAGIDQRHDLFHVGPRDCAHPERPQRRHAHGQALVGDDCDPRP